MYTLMCLQSKQAKKENKQAFTYIDFTRMEVIPPWYTDEAVGGVSTGITEELKLAADTNTSGIMALHNNINKAFQKTRFLKRREQWMMIFMTRYLPAALATGRLTLVVAIIHFDFIC